MPQRFFYVARLVVGPAELCPGDARPLWHALATSGAAITACLPVCTYRPKVLPVHQRLSIDGTKKPTGANRTPMGRNVAVRGAQPAFCTSSDRAAATSASRPLTTF